MPTQRPYFANFLAAFRAHSAFKSSTNPVPSTASAAASQSTNYSTLQSTQSQATSTSSPSSSTASPTAASSQSASPQPTPTRPIPGKTQAGLAAAAAAFSPPAQHHTRHTSNVQSRSPASPLGSVGGGKFGGRARRGSDSSSDGGFRDALGGEKWFIGGRTASGEEKFYSLAMVRRERSGERASVDRMSL